MITQIWDFIWLELTVTSYYFLIIMQIGTYFCEAECEGLGTLVLDLGLWGELAAAVILSGRDGDDPRRLAETEKASPSSATRPSSREFLEKK